jgi:hypothetical protein
MGNGEWGMGNYELSILHYECGMSCPRFLDFCRGKGWNVAGCREGHLHTCGTKFTQSVNKFTQSVNKFTQSAGKFTQNAGKFTQSVGKFTQSVGKFSLYAVEQ